MDTAPSEIVDLDPEPVPPRSRLRWERILGVALLLGVIGFAGVDWWRREQQAGLYRQGQLAQTARHWDAARAAYATLGAYSDAPARLAEVQATINRRDLLLAQATGATSPRVIWQNLQGAADIEPDYPGLAARLAAARVALFEGGTAGIVYLQKTETQAGLFLTRPPAPARYLPGSDATSLLRGVAPGGRTFLYDAPSQPGDECGTPCPALPRRVILARLDAAGTLTTRLLGNLRPYGNGQFTDDGAGFWWSADDGIHYVDLTTDHLTTLPGPNEGRWLLALDPANSRVLLAAGPPGIAAPSNTLYLADANGQGERVVVAGLSGDVVLSATLSPEGRYLALITQKSDGQLTRTLWLLDLKAPNAQILDTITWDGLQIAVGLNATFVPNGDQPRLLVDHLDERGDWISMFTLPGLQRETLWSGPGLMLRYEAAAISPDGRTLALHDQVGNTGNLVLLTLDGSTAPRTFPSASYDKQRVNAMFSPLGDFLVYEVLNPDGISRGYTKPLFTLATGASDGTTPRLLGTAVMPYDSAFLAVAMPPGGDLLVYATSAGELWATTFDGAGRDRLVDRGVSAVWALRDDRAGTWFR